MNQPTKLLDYWKSPYPSLHHKWLRNFLTPLSDTERLVVALKKAVVITQIAKTLTVAVLELTEAKFDEALESYLNIIEQQNCTRDVGAVSQNQERISP